MSTSGVSTSKEKQENGYPALPENNTSLFKYLLHFGREKGFSSSSIYLFKITIILRALPSNSPTLQALSALKIVLSQVTEMPCDLSSIVLHGSMTCDTLSSIWSRVGSYCLGLKAVLPVAPTGKTQQEAATRSSSQQGQAHRHKAWKGRMKNEWK